MRRILLGAALAALLAILMAAPADAVPPNEILIAKNLQRLGVIPSYATPTMAEAAVQALGATGARSQVRPPVGKASAGASLRRELTARVVDPSATRTYVANALVLLVEFGDAAWPAGSPDPTGPMTPGPAHGGVPAPAADDNFTFWPGDSSPRHYQQMLFGASFPIYDASGNRRGASDDTMRNYYLEQSHGAYTVSGEIADWVMLDRPESWYGADSEPWDSLDDLTGPVWRVARDAIARFAAENPGFDWAQYDQENPWGITGDDFHRPDGYLDHLILVHAGSDQSAGGGAQASDAIWAHSGSIGEHDSGGPGDGPGMMIPGTGGQGPQGKGIWAYNYTINPEDGAIGVFCHELAHDLGLDDQYDYSTEIQDTSSGFWTLMAQGGWLGRTWGAGTKPAAMNVDDKTILGFVKPKIVKRGTTATVKLQPAATGTTTATGVKILLPRARHVTQIGGRDGATEWYSTVGNDLDVSLVSRRPVTVPADGDLTFRTWYEIEEGYDHGLVAVSDDGGATWTTLRDFSGIDTEHWADTITVDLADYEGKAVLVRFTYRTDSYYALRGWKVTDVAVAGIRIPASGFRADGWVRVDGEYVQTTERYYLAEYRTYDGFDKSLKDCYQFNNAYTSWVDRFSYNRGLHLIYRDTFYTDNDVAMHVGHGARMVVDARPLPDGVAYDGAVGFWRPRIQVRDAAFGLTPTRTHSIFFTDYEAGVNVGERIAPGKRAQPWFKDSNTYWYPETPVAGVKLPKLGVRIQVKAMSSSAMTIWVDNKK
jgi:immune inhibitor A